MAKKTTTSVAAAGIDPLRMSPEQLQLRQLVINSADNAFREKGIKKVTMDDVSKNLKMSKRTLYQFFKDKEELVFACVKANLDHQRKFIEHVAKRSTNVMEIMLSVVQYRLVDFSTMSNLYLKERSEYASVAQYLRQRRIESDKEFVELLELGVQQGLCRDDIDYKVMVDSLAHLIDAVMQGGDIGEISIELFIKNFVYVLFRGCVTEKGLGIFNQFHANLAATVEESAQQM